MIKHIILAILGAIIVILTVASASATYYTNPYVAPPYSQYNGYQYSHYTGGSTYDWGISHARPYYEYENSVRGRYYTNPYVNTQYQIGWTVNHRAYSYRSYNSYSGGSLFGGHVYNTGYGTHIYI